MRRSSLPSIPLVAAAPGCDPSLAALAAEPERWRDLIASARRLYTPLGVAAADRLSRAWSGKILSPYAETVRAVEAAIDGPGAYLLNYSYEWGCTSGAMEDADLGGATLARTLDWPFDGLGRALVVTRAQGQAGVYYNVAWPGYVGVLTGMAPGRFAAAINQPPLPAPGCGVAIGWLVARGRVARSQALPPDHLLRLAFDTCRTFAEAVALIARTPICLPAIFTLAGCLPGERIVIERTQTQAFFPKDPAAANHWASEPGPKGAPRNCSSHARRDAMRAMMTAAPDWSMDWVRPPILKADTRVAVMANPATGRLLARGWEKDGLATQRFSLEPPALEPIRNDDANFLF